MKNKNITINQSIINKINAKENFTHSINKSLRYIVGSKNLFTGENPSLQYVNIYDDILKLNTKFDTIGGWTDPNTKIYYVDYSKTFEDVFEALNVARQNNEIAIYDTLENKTIKLIK